MVFLLKKKILIIVCAPLFEVLRVGCVRGDIIDMKMIKFIVYHSLIVSLSFPHCLNLFNNFSALDKFRFLWYFLFMIAYLFTGPILHSTR